MSPSTLEGLFIREMIYSYCCVGVKKKLSTWLCKYWESGWIMCQGVGNTFQSSWWNVFPEAMIFLNQCKGALIDCVNFVAMHKYM